MLRTKNISFFQKDTFEKEDGEKASFLMFFPAAGRPVAAPLFWPAPLVLPRILASFKQVFPGEREQGGAIPGEEKCEKLGGAGTRRERGVREK